jgi:hypothetical protein
MHYVEWTQLACSDLNSFRMSVAMTNAVCVNRATSFQYPTATLPRLALPVHFPPCSIPTCALKSAIHGLSARKLYEIDVVRNREWPSGDVDTGVWGHYWRDLGLPGSFRGTVDAPMAREGIRCLYLNALPQQRSG